MTPEDIREYRNKLSLTQGQLSRRIGITSAMLGAIERKERRLTKPVEAKLREAFDQQIEDTRKFIEVYESMNRIDVG